MPPQVAVSRAGNFSTSPLSKTWWWVTCRIAVWPSTYVTGPDAVKWVAPLPVWWDLVGKGEAVRPRADKVVVTVEEIRHAGDTSQNVDPLLAVGARSR